MLSSALFPILSLPDFWVSINFIKIEINLRFSLMALRSLSFFFRFGKKNLVNNLRLILVLSVCIRANP